LGPRKTLWTLLGNRKGGPGITTRERYFAPKKCQGKIPHNRRQGEKGRVVGAKRKEKGSRDRTELFGKMYGGEK